MARRWCVRSGVLINCLCRSWYSARYFGTAWVGPVSNGFPSNVRMPPHGTLTTASCSRGQPFANLVGISDIFFCGSLLQVIAPARRFRPWTQITRTVVGTLCRRCQAHRSPPRSAGRKNAGKDHTNIGTVPCGTTTAPC